MLLITGTTAGWWSLEQQLLITGMTVAHHQNNALYTTEITVAEHQDDSWSSINPTVCFLFCLPTV